jgi:hypothetical protein
MPAPTGCGRESAIPSRSSHNPTLPGFSRNEFHCQPTAGTKRSGDSMRRFGLLRLRRGTTTPSLGLRSAQPENRGQREGAIPKTRNAPTRCSTHARRADVRLATGFRFRQIRKH